MTDNRIGSYRVVRQDWDGEHWVTKKVLRGPIMPEDKQNRAIDDMFSDIGNVDTVRIAILIGIILILIGYMANPGCI